MDLTTRISSSMSTISVHSPSMPHLQRSSLYGFRGRQPTTPINALSNNGAISRSYLNAASWNAVEDAHSRISSLKSLFCYEKAIREEIIEMPVGLSLAEKIIGFNPCCPNCQAKGTVLCSTCSGSGLYVDSILESQGIIVKVRCLSCGGTGNTLCSECGGRCHVDLK